MRILFYKIILWFIQADIVIARSTGRTHEDLIRLKREESYWQSKLTLLRIHNDLC